jgi:MFS family permease
MPDAQPSSPGPAGNDAASGQGFSLRSLVWTVYAPSFLLAFGQGILVPVLPIFAKDDLLASPAMVGIVVASRELGTMAFDVPAGLATSRFGTKAAMLAGTGLFAITAVGAALSPGLAFLIAMRIAAGIGIAAWGISRHAYIAQVVPQQYRGRALSLFGGLGRIATILGPLAGGLIGQYYGLRAPFYLQAGVGVATMALVLATLEKTAPVAHKGGVSAHKRLAATVVEYRKEFATAGLAAIALQLMRSSRQLLIPLWGDSIGLNPGQIGYVVSISSAVDSVMFVPAGYVMDRWGRRWTGGPSLIILAIALALLPLADNFAMLAAVGVVAGLGNGLSSGLVLTMGADIAPRDAAGEFLGVWRLITDSGGAAGPLAVGWIEQALRLSTACLATSGIGIAGAAVMIFLVQETTEAQKRHSARKT